MTRHASNSARRKGTVRCAIYTRKSSEEGSSKNLIRCRRSARPVRPSLPAFVALRIAA